VICGQIKGAIVFFDQQCYCIGGRQFLQPGIVRALAYEFAAKKSQMIAMTVQRFDRQISPKQPDQERLEELNDLSSSNIGPIEHPEIRPSLQV